MKIQKISKNNSGKFGKFEKNGIKNFKKQNIQEKSGNL